MILIRCYYLVSKKPRQVAIFILDIFQNYFNRIKSFKQEGIVFLLSETIKIKFQVVKPGAQLSIIVHYPKTYINFSALLKIKNSAQIMIVS